ncbi:hypothetical protein B0H11DRAFT_1942026 [Mycena galericulata]|nr:hypothetical protein B0H11DRAFT_1942026 [Mycena galericulata]
MVGGSKIRKVAVHVTSVTCRAALGYRTGIRDVIGNSVPSAEFETLRSLLPTTMSLVRLDGRVADGGGGAGAGRGYQRSVLCNVMKIANLERQEWVSEAEKGGRATWWTYVGAANLMAGTGGDAAGEERLGDQPTAGGKTRGGVPLRAGIASVRVSRRDRAGEEKMGNQPKRGGRVRRGAPRREGMHLEADNVEARRGWNGAGLLTAASIVQPTFLFRDEKGGMNCRDSYIEKKRGHLKARGHRRQWGKLKFMVSKPAPLEQELELPQSKNKGPGRGRAPANAAATKSKSKKSKSKSTTKAKSAPEEEESEDEASKGQASAKPELPSAEDDAGEGHSRKEGDNAFLRNAEEEEGKDVLQEEGDDVLIPNTKEEGDEDVFEEKEGEDVFMPNTEEEGGEDVFQEEGNDVFMRNAEAEGGEDVFREEGNVFMPNAEEAEAEGGDPFQENKVETAWVPPPPRSPARGERVTRSSPGRPRPAWHGGDARRLEFETTGDLDGWDLSRRRQRAPVDEDDEDEGLSGNPHLNNLSPRPRVQTRMHSARHNASRPSSPHAHPLASPRTPMNSRVRSPPAATPLPPSSPFRTSPPLESDADDSDDDYGRQQEEKRRLAAKRLARGFPSPPTVDTEEEDLEDEREFEASIALPAPKKRTAAANAKTVTRARPAAKKGKGKDKSGVMKESEPPSRQKKGKEKANAKGSDLDSDHTDPQPAKKSKRRTKQKKAAAPAEAYGVDSTDEGEDSDAEGEGEDAAGSKSGPVPQEIRDQLFAAQDAFHNKIAALAEKCGKDPQVLHQLLGTTPKMARNLTAWNTWQSWYSEHHPKSKEVDRTEYARISRQAFVDALPNLNKNELADSALVFETIPWLKKWHEETMANAINNWRDNGKFKSVVRKAIKPIIHQSRLFHSSLGVHLWGYVIDPNGEASFAFGGTDDFKAVRSENKFALSSFIAEPSGLATLGNLPIRQHLLQGQT